MNCLIPVPPNAIAELREELTDRVGPRESHLSWVSPEFDAAAKDAYVRLELPPITLETCWFTYVELVRYFTDTVVFRPIDH